MNFVNTCFEEGVFPDVFKISSILLLIKKSELIKNSIESDRPIANLSNVTFNLSSAIEYLEREPLVSHNNQPTVKTTETSLLYSFNSFVSFLDENKLFN